MAEGSGRTEQHSRCGNGGSGKRSYHPFMQSQLNEFYYMNHKNRGKALIFNHDRYLDIDLEIRKGSFKDSEDMEGCLNELGFDVDVFHNLKYGEIMEHIEQTAAMNHSNNDCLLIAVFTHGEASGFLHAFDTHYRLEKLWCRFTDENCPTLVGKPKLFVIQACQGDKYDDGITLTRDIETDGWFEPNKIPVNPDFLIALSSVPGYYSWRNRDRGSWFIQALCEELHYSAKEMDILSLLTLVNRNVALNFESNTLKHVSNHKKVVPCFSSMLTRRLMFTTKADNSNSLECCNCIPT